MISFVHILINNNLNISTMKNEVSLTYKRSDPIVDNEPSAIDTLFERQFNQLHPISENPLDSFMEGRDITHKLQLRGGGGNENDEEAGLIAKIIQYKENLKQDNSLEEDFKLYIKPTGSTNICKTKKNSSLKVLDLAFDIYKNFLNNSSSEKVLLLMGEAGIGKSLFCKYIRNALLFDWVIEDQESSKTLWLPILIDLSKFNKSEIATVITETLRKHFHWAPPDSIPNGNSA